MKTRVASTLEVIFGPILRPWRAFDAWWARKLPGWQGEVASFGLWILFFFFFMPTLLWQPFHIPSASMENTLIEGDYIFVTKYAYGYSEHSTYPLKLFNFDGRIWGATPQRGDVVVFKFPPDPRKDYIKRLVGLPGDRIQVNNGVLFINGAPVQLVRGEDWPERNEKEPPAQVPYFTETLPNGRSHAVLDRRITPFDQTKEYVVPEGHFFMMGDNRDNSDDSRGEVGFVPFDNVVGRADIVFFSLRADHRWWQIWRFPFSIRYDRLLTTIS